MYDDRWEEAIAGYDLVASPNEKLNAVFLAQYLLGDRAQRFFKSQRDRSAQPHLNSDQLGNTLVPLPPHSEQGDIAGALITCDSKIAALEQEVGLLEELFRAMLEELMTGRLSALPLVEAEGAA
jgi:type I restriction enzyme S subunit